MVSSLFAGMARSSLLIEEHAHGAITDLRKLAQPNQRWPDNSRNAGRLQIAIVADIKSERWQGSNRNSWPASIGICTRRRRRRLKKLENPDRRDRQHAS
jgi:hypothetical protein